MLREWLQETLQQMSLSDDLCGYLYGRGFTDDLIRHTAPVQWDGQRVSQCPDADFSKKYLWGVLNERVIFPIRAPDDTLLGFESRTWGDRPKQMLQILLPEAQEHPVFLGMSPSVMDAVWAGGDVWIVEGIFDLAAMQHIIPQRDVVLSTLRARVSPRHADFLQRYLRDGQIVRMCYDNDETGRQQTHGFTDPKSKKRVRGALDILRGVGVACRDETYRGGKDPGEIWQTGGVTRLRKAFNLEERDGE